ncbi:MAG TPA: murein biosynthesis integral membrane protein MurJ [Gemmatimonadales bacterium]|nr:murein biosynthesis integral membrane protein MurJ [Gemmatimonadales bacterium]
MAERRATAAPVVAAGILLSRISGLVRQRVLAHFLGLTDAADAFAAAFRIPNFLQNLFGEGVLSASFIPVYARLESQGHRDEARRVAGAVAGLLAAVVAILVALGVTTAPWLAAGLAPGFTGAKRELVIQLVRIVFPGTGLLVFSAWCLGILNSHRRFLLSYAAPVAWNAAIVIAALLAPAGSGADRIVFWTAWGAVVGALLQLGIQLPAVRRLAGPVRLSLDTTGPSIGTVLRNFFPAFIGRGVVQISAFVDEIIASLLPTGALAALANAQMLYTLPVSLFGMSVAAAELPELAVDAGAGEDSEARLRQRVEAAMNQVAYFVVPSVVALAGLGHVIAAAVFQTGLFTRADSLYVWGILAGSAVGLLATTLGRVYASAWYALQDARTPLRFALVRVGLTTGLGYVAAVYGPDWAGIPARWGVAGLTASAGLAGWAEFVMLRRSLDHRIGATRLDPRYVVRLWLAALAAGGAAWAVLGTIGYRLPPVATALAVLLPYGMVYVAGTLALRVPLAVRWAGRILRK